MVLAPTVIAFAYASAGAQVSSDSVQDHTLSGGQRNNPQLTSASPLSPLLGAPQDDAENYLPNRVSSTAQGHASTRGSNKRDQKAAPDSAASPLLGAPEDYEDSYSSGLGDGPEKQVATREAANYKLTPVEQLLAPKLAEGRSASSEGDTAHGDVAGTRVASGRRESHEFEPPTAISPTSSSASQLNSLSDLTGSRTTNTIYRSPW
jgi:hypothetical protein